MAIPVTIKGLQASALSDIGVAPPDTVNPLFKTVYMPADAQSWLLIIVATIAIVFALEWAQRFFIPLLLGIVLAYTLNPLVVWLERYCPKKDFRRLRESSGHLVR